MAAVSGSFLFLVTNPFRQRSALLFSLSFRAFLCHFSQPFRSLWRRFSLRRLYGRLVLSFGLIIFDGIARHFVLSFLMDLSRRLSSHFEGLHAILCLCRWLHGFRVTFWPISLPARFLIHSI